MLKGEEWMEIRQMYKQGVRIKHIAEILGISRTTVYKNLEKERKPKYERIKKEPSILEPFKEYIRERLEKINLTAQKIFEEVKQMGYGGRYGIVAKDVREIKKEYKNKAVLRFETIPGEQAQVDWGYLGKIYDKRQRRWIKLHCFLMILGYSRMLYIEVFERANLKNFLIGHNNAFKYFEGYTREILYDNLKSVVIKRALRAEDSEFNKRFMDFAGYYGFKPILCRLYKPNTKGKVENSVNFAKQNFYAGEEFNSLEEINEMVQEWLEKINQRIHGTTKEKPIERLKRETLNKLDNKPLFDPRELYYRQVFRDCHFSFAGNRYSVPHEYAGKEVAIKEIDEENIVVIYRDKEIANHKINKEEKGIYITKKEHLTGLLELRKSHGIKKPIKKKPQNNKSGITLIKYNKNIEVVQKRDLRYYEEKTGYAANNV